MTTREQDLQQLKACLSQVIGNQHIQTLKSDIKDLQKRQEELQQESEKKIEEEPIPQELSFGAKNAPVLGALAGAVIVLQFAMLDIGRLLIVTAIAAVIGFIIGIFIKKGKQSDIQDAIKASEKAKIQEEQKYKERLAEIKEQGVTLQKELKATQEDVAFLKKNSRLSSELESFCKAYGMKEVEVLLLYFERGRADSVEEAIELYKDEAQDKARINRAKEELDRSIHAYMNTYIETMNRFGRKREYDSMEAAARKHNENLARENEELRDIMNMPKNK